MNLQEAYNKGLDDAETVVISKLTNAFDGVDDGPFPNPELEKLRQIILTNPNEKSIVPILKSILNGEEYQFVGTEEDTTIVKFYDELVQYLKTLLNKQSKIGVRLKDMFSKINYYLTLKKSQLK